MKSETMQAGEGLPFRWLGGRPALDFANTTAWGRFGGRWSEQEQQEYERFTRYARLVEWARAAELLDDRQAAALLVEAEQRPEEARLALGQAVALRQAIHGMFVRVLNRHPVDQTFLGMLNATLSDGMARLRVEAGENGFAMEWSGGDTTLTRPIWSVAQDAAELLISDDLSRVRECSGDICGFLFLDRSHPGRRRWCEMRVCGNRAKARRHHQRVRAAHH